jgi:hypothetical protein
MKTVAEYFNELANTIKTVEGVYKKGDQFIFVKVDENKGVCIDGNKESPVSYDVRFYNYNSLGLIYSEFKKLGQIKVILDPNEIHDFLGEKLMTIEESNKFWEDVSIRLGKFFSYYNKYNNCSNINRFITQDNHVLRIYPPSPNLFKPFPSYEIVEIDSKYILDNKTILPKEISSELIKLLEQIFKEFASLPNI